MDIGEIVIIGLLGAMAWLFLKSKGSAAENAQTSNQANDASSAFSGGDSLDGGIQGVGLSGNSAYPTTSMNQNLQNFLGAIQNQEGWYPGSMSYRDNNPGNLRPGGTEADYPDQATGTNALQGYVQGLYGSHPDWDFYDFFNYYLRGSTTANPIDAQGDSNAYAENVASSLGVDPTQTVSSVLPPVQTQGVS